MIDSYEYLEAENAQIENDLGALLETLEQCDFLTPAQWLQAVQDAAISYHLMLTWRTEIVSIYHDFIRTHY